MRTSTAKLQTASKEQLVAYISAEAAKIKTLNATVDIATSVGGEKKGKVTDYEEIRGYILVRKPNLLRMIGLCSPRAQQGLRHGERREPVQAVDPGARTSSTSATTISCIQGPAPWRTCARKSSMTRCCCRRSIRRTISRYWSRVPRSSTTLRIKKELEQPDYVVDIIHREGDRVVSGAQNRLRSHHSDAA